MNKAFAIFNGVEHWICASAEKAVPSKIIDFRTTEKLRLELRPPGAIINTFQSQFDISFILCFEANKDSESSHSLCVTDIGFLFPLFGTNFWPKLNNRELSISVNTTVTSICI